MTVGQPPKFKSLKELNTAIENYFSDCDTKKVPYTVTGLALGIGFLSRQSIYDYANGRAGGKERDRYAYTVKKALLRIENYAEAKLFSNHATGAIFALKNRGWSDKQEFEHSGTVTTKNYDLSKLSDKELKRLDEITSKM